MKYLIVLLVVFLSACHSNDAPNPVPTQTVSPTPTPTETSTPQPTPTVTVTATPTPTPTVTSSPSPSPTSTPSPSPTASPSPSPTLTPSDEPYRGDAVFQSYVNLFVRDGRAQGRETSVADVEIRLTEIPGYGTSVIGLCSSYGSGINDVQIRKSWWDRVSETQRILLVHHELGHCVLYRGHRSAVDASGIPLSIMYPVIISSSTFTSRKDSYLNELFTYGWSPGSGQDRISAHHVCGPSHF